MQTVFYGNSSFVLPLLRYLKPSNIVTTEKLPTDPVLKYAVDNSIPYLSVANLTNENVIKQIKEINAEVAVLADFGLIIPRAVLNLYPKGILNIHPSLLPKYRGPTPVQSALLNGDYATGVTLMKLDSELDHGPILAQKQVLLSDTDTSETGYLKLFSEGAQLLNENMENYLSGKLEPVQQDHSLATYTAKLTRESGYFDIAKPPTADILERIVYAYYPWPGVWTKILMTNSARAQINGKWQILKFLPDGKLQMEGKKPVSLKDFYNGYPELKETLEKILNIKT